MVTSGDCWRVPSLSFTLLLLVLLLATQQPEFQMNRGWLKILSLAIESVGRLRKDTNPDLLWTAQADLAAHHGSNHYTHHEYHIFILNRIARLIGPAPLWCGQNCLVAPRGMAGFKVCSSLKYN